MSPHTELAPASPQIQERNVQEQGAAEPQSTSEKNKIGVFARILAGLSGRSSIRKTGTGENAAEAINPEKFPLAANELGKKNLIHGEKTKGVRAEKLSSIEKTDTKKLRAHGADETEIPLSEPATPEKNLVFTVGRLTGQSEEPQAEGKAQGEKTVGNVRADLRRSGQETTTTKTASAERVHGEGAQNIEKQPLTTNTAGGEEAAQNLKIAGEKAKNRLNFAENGVKDRFAAEEAAGEHQRTEAKKAVPGDREGRSKLEEARNRRRSAAFEVRDFRNGGEVTAASHNGAHTGVESRALGEGSGKDIVLELRLPNHGQEASTATNSWEAKAGQSFEDMLARELHQNFNNDIVRHASVALRDGNEGTIRLALKPESLGNVKIRLELAENKIVGHIVVESEEALRAFEREIASLEKAFRESGFDGAHLDMSLATDGRGAENQWQETEASRFLTGQFAASRYDAAIEQMEMPLTLDVYQHGATAINMLA